MTVVLCSAEALSRSEIEGRPHACPSDILSPGGAQKAIYQEIIHRGVDIEVRRRLPFDLKIQGLAEKPLVVCVSRDDRHTRWLIEAVADVLPPKDVDTAHERQIPPRLNSA